MPLHTPDFTNALSTASTDLGNKWLSAAEKGLVYEKGIATDMAGWSTQQKILFLEMFLTHLSKQDDDADDDSNDDNKNNNTQKQKKKAINNSGGVFSEPFLKALDKSYSLTTSQNAEIKFRWQSICLKCEMAWIVPHVTTFITSQGRMKYVRPLYRALGKSMVGKKAGVEAFRNSWKMYHSIARKMIQADFKSAGIDIGEEGFVSSSNSKKSTSSSSSSSSSNGNSSSSSTVSLPFVGTVGTGLFWSIIASTGFFAMSVFMKRNAR